MNPGGDQIREAQLKAAETLPFLETVDLDWVAVWHLYRHFKSAHFVPEAMPLVGEHYARALVSLLECQHTRGPGCLHRPHTLNSTKHQHHQLLTREVKWRSGDAGGAHGRPIATVLDGSKRYHQETG